LQESNHQWVAEWSEAGAWQEHISRTIYHQFFKRPLDMVVGIVALIASLPIMAVASLAIWLESRGGPIYKQKRVGKNGRLFELYKLRTMYVGADEAGFKTADQDPRVTRIGTFLRDKKIDELPQLFNVLRGEMSLIGPRPLSLEETDHLTGQLGFSKTDPGLCPRVRPGLTGLEQIYRIHPLSYADRFRWNNGYEEDLSFKIDLKIFLTTILQYRAVCAITACIGIFQLLVFNSIL
jgi:lipopolysaccharide/colanic/teichoic acid biosynthesis glycosyltransferase